MNREQTIESIKAVRRTCRGPRPDHLPEKLRIRLDHAIEQKDVKLFEQHCNRFGLPLGCAMRLIGEAAGPPPTVPQLIVELLESGETDVAAQLDKASRVAWCREHLGRNACGQDVNELIAASELDGEEHQVTCPTCGTVITFVPPRAD